MFLLILFNHILTKSLDNSSLCLRNKPNVVKYWYLDDLFGVNKPNNRGK